MRLFRTVAPLEEPVTLAEAKAFARVDIDDDDELIESLIASSREFVENYIGAALITQTWTITYDDRDRFFASAWLNRRRSLRLPIRPVQSITSFKTYDPNNVATTFSDTAYRVAGDKIVLNDNYDWPIFATREFDSQEIVFVTGYGSADDVPQMLKQAIMELVTYKYENRGDAKAETSVPFGITAMLEPYKTYTLA